MSKRRGGGEEGGVRAREGEGDGDRQRVTKHDCHSGGRERERERDKGRFNLHTSITRGYRSLQFTVYSHQGAVGGLH